MFKKKNLALIALTLVSGCTAMNQQPPLPATNARIVSRDLSTGSTDTNRVRIMNANLVTPSKPSQASTVALKDATPVVPPMPTTRFKFESSDLSFKLALTRWVKIAGWQLAWEAEKDFPGRISADFSNDFEVAVADATKAYRNSDYPLKSCTYDNKVVRVVRFLGTGKECDITN